VVTDQGTSTFWVETRLDGAPFPPAEHTAVRARIRALPARGNSPPRPVLEAAAAGRRAQEAPRGELELITGESILLSGERSSDPEGDRIIAYLWDLGEGASARGARIVHRFSGPGPRTITLTVVDEAGARATLARTLMIRTPPPPGCGGCCLPGRAGAAALGAMAVVVALVIVGWRFRRKKAKNRMQTEHHDES